MGRLLLFSVAVALGLCTLTACGERTGSGASSSISTPAATPSPSPTTDATTAAYRHVLEQGSGLLNSDANSFDSGCNLGVAPFMDSCRRWALEDEALVNQVVGLLSNAQVPAADASNDQLLRQGLQMRVADDIAAAGAVGSGNEVAARSALDKLRTDLCTVVGPVLSRLDPNIPNLPYC